ncbi:hypothetical protein BGZ83_007941 [Gryganskiella cystojenkinii]|nr:hypothetical protein BGZ83_007941 [Gryganskiella cystojenkinii]
MNTVPVVVPTIVLTGQRLLLGGAQAQQSSSGLRRSRSSEPLRSTTQATPTAVSTSPIGSQSTANAVPTTVLSGRAQVTGTQATPSSNPKVLTGPRLGSHSAQLRTDIFSSSVPKPSEATALPRRIGDPIENTSQLAHCGRLLLQQELSAASSSSAPPFSSPSYSPYSSHPSTSSTLFPPSPALSNASTLSASSPMVPTPTSSSSTSTLTTSVSTQLSSSPTAVPASQIDISAIIKPFNERELEWAEKVKDSPEEKERIQLLLIEVVRQFINDDLKDLDAIQEVVLVAPALNKDHYRRLLEHFLKKLDNASLMDVPLLQGLVQLVQVAPLGHLRDDDMIRTLRTARQLLGDPSRQLKDDSIHFALALSRILDILACNKVKDLNRVEEHGPLLEILQAAKASKDPILKFQTLYAFQALMRVPDDESAGQSILRHLGETARGLLLMSNIYQFEFDGLVEGLPAAIKGGLGLFADLKEALGATSNEPWYDAVRGVEVLVRAGLFTNMNMIVADSPYINDPLFQWSLCQLLGAIAVDPCLNETNREQAITFLGEIFRLDQGSKKHQDVRRWIVTILKNIETLPAIVSPSNVNHNAIVQQASILVKELEKDAIPFTSSYPLQRCLPLPKRFSLLERANKISPTEQRLHMIRCEKALHSRGIYIPLMSRTNLQDRHGGQVPLKTRVDAFRRSEKEVMLILGDSGAGKTTFLSWLEYDLWDQYSRGQPIPLFIDLKTAGDLQANDIVERKLKINNFKDDQICQLREQRQFILLCDGYDEWGKRQNILKIHKIVTSDRWRVKIIISCRSQPFYSDYRNRFAPEGRGSRLFEEAVIVPFQLDQIEQYIDQYRKDPSAQDSFRDIPVWTTNEYLKKLTQLMIRHTHIKDLVANPLLLKLVLDSLPDVFGKDDSNNTSVQLSQVGLIDNFVWRAFKFEQNRLDEQDYMLPEHRAAFESMGNRFITTGIDFSKELSRSMLKREVNLVEYWIYRQNDPWKVRFFGDNEPKVQLLRRACQLVCHGDIQESTISTGPRTDMGLKNVWEFIHVSLLEYYYSLSLYDCPCPSTRETSRFWSPSFRCGPVCLDSIATVPCLELLNARSIVANPFIAFFLAERVQQDDDFREQLCLILELSKTDEDVVVAASNAITILVRARLQFNGLDLRGIRIPGADCTGGYFDSALLGDAVLSGVNFTRAWLRQTNFRGAKMIGSKFGEGVADSGHGPLKREHVDQVRKVLYSPDGEYIVSCSNDHSVRMWKSSSGSSSRLTKCLVSDLAFSSDGRRLAITDSQGQLQLLALQEDYTIQEGTAEILNVDDTGSVFSVSYSSRGYWRAFGHGDGSVSLWDFESVNNPIRFNLHGHDQAVNTIVFSPDGRWLASSSKDGKVRVWSMETKDRTLLLDLELEPSSLDFSPCSAMIAVSQGNTVQLWDVIKSAAIVHDLAGHESAVKSLAWSPCGRFIVTGESDNTMRLWQMQPNGSATSGSLELEIRELKGPVLSLAWNPNSSLEFVSGCEDFSVCVWKAVVNGDAVSVQLVWGSLAEQSVYTGVKIDRATGLDEEQRKLLGGSSAQSEETNTAEDEVWEEVEEDDGEAKKNRAKKVKYQ